EEPPRQDRGHAGLQVDDDPQLADDAGPPRAHGGSRDRGLTTRRAPPAHKPSTGRCACVRCGSVNPPTAASSRPGAVSRFLAWTDGLPGHGWWVFPALALLLFALAPDIAWASGRVPWGVVEPVIAVGVPYGPFLLALLAATNYV